MIENLVLESFSTKSIDRKRKSNNSVNDTKESSRPFKSRKTNIFEINNKGENSLILAYLQNLLWKILQINYKIHNIKYSFLLLLIKKFLQILYNS